MVITVYGWMVWTNGQKVGWTDWWKDKLMFAFYYRRICILRPLWRQISKSRIDLNLTAIPSSPFQANTILSEWLSIIRNNAFTKCSSIRSKDATLQHTALCVCVCQQWFFSLLVFGYLGCCRHYPILNTWTSINDPQFNILNAWSIIFNLKSLIFNPKPQSSFGIPQSSILILLSSIHFSQ